MELRDNRGCWPDVNDFIEFAENLQKRVNKLGSIQGIRKLERKIGAELKFMNQLKQRDLHTQQSRLKSSNLGHFASLVHASELLPGVTGVLVPYQLPSRSDSLLVDLLALRGHVWVKVVARKAQALHLVWAGAGQFGERDLLSQASEYLECAARHPYNFCTPQIHFAFYNQVTDSMAAALEQLGVQVWGQRVPVDSAVLDKLQGLESEDSSQDSDCDEEHLDVDYWNDNRLSGKGLDHFPLQDTPQSDSLLYQLHTAENNLTVQDSKDEYSSVLPVEESAISISHPERNMELTSQGRSEAGCVSSAPSASAVPCNLHSEPDCVSSPDRRQLFLELVVSPPDFQSFTSTLSRDLDQNLSRLLSPSPTLSATHATNLKSSTSSSLAAEAVSDIQRVNLDITTLIALVSSVTNGRCHLVFRDKVLTTQALEERQAPVLPILNRFLSGKEMFACETAVSSFRSILNILGGPEEKERALTFLARVKIVPDQPSARALELTCQGRVKERSKVVFGTGDTLHAITVTSNMGFVRAAQSQGVVFPVFLHPARALTEEKEPSAKPLSV